MGPQLFSQDWHNWIQEVMVEGSSPLVEIEGQLDEITLALRGMSPLLAKGETAEKLRGELPFDTAQALRWSAFLLDMLRRKVLVRARHLGAAYVETMNAENYTAVPLLLRAIMEEGCLGVYAGDRIRVAWPRYREEGEWDEFYTTLLRPLLGSKVDQEVLQSNLRRLLGPEPAPDDIVRTEIGLYLTAAEQGVLEVQAKDDNPGPYPAATNTLTLIRVVSRLLANEKKIVEREEWLPAIYSYLSDQCHPSYGSWRYTHNEIVDGGSFTRTEAEREESRRSAMVEFADLGREYIFPLTMIGFSLISETLRDVKDDLQVLTLGRKS